MSLANPLVLSPDCATDVDTNENSLDQRYGDVGKAVYSLAGLTAPAELKLTVSHEETKSGRLRHLVRLDRTVVDANLVPASASAYVVVDRELNTALTNTVLIELVNQLVDFLIEGGANANVVKLLNSEV